jgi:hypothetical protein
MKNLKIIGALAALIMLSAISGTFAQTRTPGVAVGNSFKYAYTFTMNTDGKQGILPDILQPLIDQAKAIDWVQITITSVSGTAVTAQTLMQFKNGTQQSSTGTTDVSTGQGDLTMFLIAANLNPNDQIYPGNENGKINETITQIYSSGTREVNHESIITNYDVTQEELSGFNITGPLQQTNSQNIFWDKQIGSLVEMSYSMQTRSDQVNADISVNVDLVETNVYTIPEYPAIIIVLIALIASTIVVIKLHQKLPKTIPL